MGPSQTTLKDFQETERFLREQIKELDAQLMALDNAFRMGKHLFLKKKIIYESI